MRSTITAALVGVIVVIGGVGISLSRVDAASSVTPQSGPSGELVYGLLRGEALRTKTMLFRVDLNGTTTSMFSIDVAAPIEMGVPYNETGWAPGAVPNHEQVAWVLAHTTAADTNDPTEITAAQAAIWHFSDGFVLDAANPKNAPEVVARYEELLRGAEAARAERPRIESVTVDPTEATANEGSPIFYRVVAAGGTPVAIELSDARVEAHPVVGGRCETDTALATVVGSASFCLTADDGVRSVSATLRTNDAPSNAGRVFVRDDRRALIVGKRGASVAHATVTAVWADPATDNVTSTIANTNTTVGSTDNTTVGSTDNTPIAAPSVTITCPMPLVYGEPATLIANGADPAGGPRLTYVWAINGVPVHGVQTARLSTSFEAGDVVTVTAMSEQGVVSAEARANCEGSSRPVVTLRCPDAIASGRPNSFNASGFDPDGDGLTWEWSVNGRIIDSETGPRALLETDPGDRVMVRAVDATGLSSATAASTCTGTAAPSIAVACPSVIIRDEPLRLTATASDPDGDSVHYRWRRDGAEVPSSVGATFSEVIAGDGVIEVSAIDPTGRESDTAVVDCVGAAARLRPELTLACLDEATDGASTRIAATVTNLPAGDAWSFTWAVNGRILDGEFGPTIGVELGPDDVVAANVTTDGAMTSVTRQIRCGAGPQGSARFAGGERGVSERADRQIPSTAVTLAERIAQADRRAAAAALAMTGSNPPGAVIAGVIAAVLGAVALWWRRRRSAVTGA